MDYEAKERYAINIWFDNEVILKEKGVSEEEIETLAEITSIRHVLHSCDREDLYFTENANFDNLWEIVNQLQDWAGVYIVDEFDSPLDTDDETDYSFAVDFYYQKVEKINDAVEAKLKEIDKKYNTSLCPTGKSRIF